MVAGPPGPKPIHSRHPRNGARWFGRPTPRRTEPIANSPWLRVLAEPTGSYQDISNTWIAHGYLSSSSYMPSQISVFAKLVPLSPGDRIAIAVVSARRSNDLRKV